MARRGGASLLKLLRQQGKPNETLLCERLTVGCVSHAEVCGDVGGDVREASQLAVKQRMRSVTNIQKITKAMKMVAASKMRIAQVNTEKSRGMIAPFLNLLGDFPGLDVEKSVTVPVSSDKGLCGGINSSVTKYARGTAKASASEDSKKHYVVIGEKGRAQLARAEPSAISETIADIGKVRITFAQAAVVAEELLKTDYDALRFIYNRFQSAISFKPTVATVLSPDTLERELESGGKLDTYEVEGPDRSQLLQDLAEFQLAVVLFNALMESNCSEQASRMAAMESSTKNATEMLGKLTLSYNRSRQASITTELTEIISGASALEG